MSKKTSIVIHHTYSNWCDAAEVDKWHKANGWSGIGYHYLISNGYPEYSDWAKGKRRKDWDGKIEAGRKPDTSRGAHVKEGNMNTKSIGVSLVGNFDSYLPTENQMESAVRLCAELCTKHGISPDAIYYHRDYAIGANGKPYKSCPGNKFISREKFRQLVRKRLTAAKVGHALAANPNLNPDASAKLVINGNVVKDAVFKQEPKGIRWFARVVDVADAVGVALMPAAARANDVVSVGDALRNWGFKKLTTNNRLKQRNRFDIRAEKV